MQCLNLFTYRYLLLHFLHFKILSFARVYQHLKKTHYYFKTNLF